MKNTIHFTQYLIIVLILTLSVSGNQPLMAARTKGLRRNWEVKTSHIGTEFPTFMDNSLSNTRICATMKSFGLFGKITFPIIKLFKYEASSSSSDPITAPGSSVCPPNHRSLSVRPFMPNHFIPTFQEYPAYPLLWINFHVSRRMLNAVTLSVTEMMRYLERLPAH